MLEKVVDIATFVAFAAVSIDVIMQIMRVHKRRSSLDVSLWGTVIRSVAVSIFVLKFIIEGDTLLIVGQTFFSALIVAYIIVIVWYRKPRKV